MASMVPLLLESLTGHQGVAIATSLWVPIGSPCCRWTCKAQLKHCSPRATPLAPQTADQLSALVTRPPS